jgi:hypothetical protein
MVSDMGECRRDYMVGRAQAAFEGSNPSLRKQSIISPNLSPGSSERSARMPLELHELGVAGSTPAGHVTAVAQLDRA